jgi:signal transduction histidine kinase
MRDLQVQNQNGQKHAGLEEHEILRSAPLKDYEAVLHLGAEILGAKAAALLIPEDENLYIKTSIGISENDFLDHPYLWKEVLPVNPGGAQKDLKQKFYKGRIDLHGMEHYLGVPLATQASDHLGMMVFFSETEMTPGSSQQECMLILTQQILNLVAFEKQKFEYQRVQQKLKQKYADLEKFASVVSHDIKSPLANIISLTELLKEENQDIFDDDTQQYIDYLSLASHSLRNYVDGLLTFYRSERILEKPEENIALNTFFEGLVKLYNVHPDVEITYPTSGTLEQVNKAALAQIFMNLISNALKYNSKPLRRVDITFTPSKGFYSFEVLDNGDGIEKEDHDKIFGLFTTLDLNDRDGIPGSGIGLATVKKLLDHMGGEISIISEPGKGSNFKFKIKRLC